MTPDTSPVFPSKTRTGVSERLPSTHPVKMSTRCVWTQVHTGVVVMCSDQPVHDRCVVFGFVTRCKEGFVNMINRNFTREDLDRHVSDYPSGPH
jgi:hypothetical protein